MTGKGVQKEFKRYAYTISDRASNLTLTHYKGDDSIVNENPHVRTCGSVLRELDNSTQSPSVVYKKKIVDCSSTMLSPVLLPRNRKQVIGQAISHLLIDNRRSSPIVNEYPQCENLLARSLIVYCISFELLHLYTFTCHVD